MKGSGPLRYPRHAWTPWYVRVHDDQSAIHKQKEKEIAARETQPNTTVSSEYDRKQTNNAHHSRVTRVCQTSPPSTPL